MKIFPGAVFRRGSAAGGLYDVIKPANKMVATLEYAQGRGSNNGLYLRFGWGF
jgi:hypothetical protein